MVECGEGSFYGVVVGSVVVDGGRGGGRCEIRRAGGGVVVV